MASVFYVRHQAEGIVHAYPFAAPPTEAQVKAVAKVCFLRWGFSHAKTPDQPYWVRVEERELLGADAVVDVPDVVLAPVTVKGHGKTESGEMSVQAEGRVENPKAGK